MLRDIIDTIREPLVVLDAEFRVQQANAAFFTTFRVHPADTIGQVLFALGDGQWDIAALRELLRDRLAVQMQLHDFEVDHVFPGIGRKIMLLNAGVMAHPPEGQRTILLAIEDVTERRLTEWRLAAHAAELERSNSALDEFASVASHDLQEPLRKILAFGDRLQASAGPSLDGEARRLLRAACSMPAARMRKLIDDLLVYSAGRPRRPQPFVPTDLAQVVREVVERPRADRGDRRQRVGSATLPTIEADPSQMRQLVPEPDRQRPEVPRARARRRVAVARRRPAAGGRCARSPCSDNGIGFDGRATPRRSSRMFQRLHGRVEYEGSGIGLAICRRIVERHGGTHHRDERPRPRRDVRRPVLPVTHPSPGLPHEMQDTRTTMPITILIC